MAVPEAIQTGFEIVWAVFNLLLGGALAAYLSRRSKERTDWSYAWTTAMPLLAESVAFLIRGVGPKGSAAVDTTFLAWQLFMHVPWLCAGAYYLFAYDRPKSLKRVMAWCYGIGFVLAIAAIAMHGQEALQKPVAALGFEAPLLSRLLYSVVYLVAASRTSACCELGLTKYALATLVVRVVAYANHAYHLATMLNPDMDTTPTFLFSRALGMAVVVIMSYLAVKMCELHGFSPPDADNGSAWKNDHISMMLGPKHRFAISSDRLWSCSYIFYFIAYALSGLCIVLITKPDFMRDPIVQMYKTIHPCILLDYLPGTHFAQPIFDLQVFCILIAMQVAFARAVLEGSYLCIFVAAASVTLFAFTGSVFQLVFTLNPTTVSVLAHSIPYMIWVVGIMMFMFSETFSVVYVHGWLKYPAFMAYVFFTLSFMLYGEYFMLDTFLGNFSTVSKPVTASGMKVVSEDFEWNHMPAFAALVLVLLYFFWYKLSPRTSTAVVLSVHVAAGDTEAVAADEQNASDGGSLGACLPVSLPLKWAVLCAAFSMVVSTYLNLKVHGREPDWSWSRNLTTLPGSAVIAVFWVQTIFGLAFHALGAVYYELQCNPSKPVKALTVISGALLVGTSLTAHGATIPSTDVDEYHGAKAFAMALALWLVVDCGLLVQARGRISPRNLVQRLAAAFLGIGLLIYRMINLSIYVDLGICFCILLWGLSDAQKIKVIFTEVRLAKAAHGVFPPLWTVEHVEQAEQEAP